MCSQCDITTAVAAVKEKRSALRGLARHGTPRLFDSKIDDPVEGDPGYGLVVAVAIVVVDIDIVVIPVIPAGIRVLIGDKMGSMSEREDMAAGRHHYCYHQLSIIFSCSWCCLFDKE